MVATQNPGSILDAFVGEGSSRQEGFTHTIFGLRIEQMYRKDESGTLVAIQNDNGQLAKGATLYSYDETSKAVQRTFLGSFLSREGKVNKATQASQFVLNMHEVTELLPQPITVEAGVDQQVAIANAFNEVFAGVTVRLKSFAKDTYYPTIDDWTADEPFHRQVRMPVGADRPVKRADATTMAAIRDQVAKVLPQD